MGIDCAFLIGPALAGLIVTQVQNSSGNELLGYSVMYRVMIVPVIAAIVVFAASRKKLLVRIKKQQVACEAEPQAYEAAH
jgi:hypothetical protein